MYWNHRVVNLSPDGEEPWLEVREVYYEDDNALMGHAEICRGSETLETLAEHYARIESAINHAILDRSLVLSTSDFHNDKVVPGTASPA